MRKKIRIVFMGTPEFAVASLKALVDNGYDVVGVVTAPDKPAGRGQKIQQSAVKEFAVKNGLIVLQPEKLQDPIFNTQLRMLKPDMQIVVAFRMLPEIVWRLPRLGTINLHASILPNYRGAAPLNWAIINGDTETGVTTFYIQQQIDTGNIILCEKVAIEPNETVGELHDKLMTIGAKLVLKTIETTTSGNADPKPQTLYLADKDKAHAPKIFRETCKIDWNKSAVQIQNLIRGLSPYPVAWCELTDGDNIFSLKIFHSEYEIETHQLAVGTIVTDRKNYLKIACTDGFVLITDLQMAGKKRIKIDDFLRGFLSIDSFRVI